MDSGEVFLNNTTGLEPCNYKTPSNSSNGRGGGSSSSSEDMVNTNIHGRLKMTSLLC